MAQRFADQSLIPSCKSGLCSTTSLFYSGMGQWKTNCAGLICNASSLLFEILFHFLKSAFTIMLANRLYMWIVLPRYNVTTTVINCISTANIEQQTSWYLSAKWMMPPWLQPDGRTWRHRDNYILFRWSQAQYLQVANDKSHPCHNTGCTLLDL